MVAFPLFALFCTRLCLGIMAETTKGTLSTSVREDRGFVSAKTGENLTLPCFYEGIVAARLYWYKQTVGQKPNLISTFYMYNKNIDFYGEFKNNSRFTLNAEKGKGKNHLTITDLRVSDSGTYFCINCYLYTLEISQSTLVNVKGSDLTALVHQSASETVQSGGFVTLNCTVLTGSCDGEHSVYWFKHSEDSPGLIYTRGGRNDQCERKPNTQTQTCEYNLPMESLNPSHAGTYYCAVASCGHILFGNGTKLDFEAGVDSGFLVHFSSIALTFTTILSVLLAFLVCMMNKKNSCQSTVPSTAEAEEYQRGENIYYAALGVNMKNRSRRQRDPTWSECVYYSVKQ
ncbi:uncharacterized protein LOC117559441 [Gymnodraco acuticeps]|uniref:Uncharacterized protein LOC117559441 n=1 Tax=Gymnodraco acuticeps TaxID=8218 RepID=A0A6P8VN81_GYMAC|nr:uncharacterized protein LOC117559441 [Gymnodraco acuticeps]